MGTLQVLKELLPEEMKELFASWGMRPYRAVQVLNWMYRHGALSFNEMTNISKADRALLQGLARIGHVEVLQRQTGSDGTQKWLIGLEDGLRVETVLIPEEGYWTQCISTQVGCAMGCAFCRTSRVGLKRQLYAWEIVDQVAAARRCFRGGRVRNVVLMGMGEPLANYDAVVRALRLILFEGGLDISKRRVTVSTCGLIPEMHRLMREGLGINLSVSLNATNDEVRTRLMPVNKKYPLNELLEACRDLPLPPRGRITFEYVLIGGLNDSLEDAKRLSRLLRGIRCKVNLIPLNPFPGCEFRPPTYEAIEGFRRVLGDAHLTVPVRWSRGCDISAACGQLAADYT